MLGEGTVHHAGTEEERPAVRLHDEGEFPFFLVAHGRPRAVRNIADPFAAFPLQHGPLRIPRVAARIAGSPVVKDSAVHRPAPGPVGIKPQTGGVFLSAASHHVPGIGVARAE